MTLHGLVVGVVAFVLFLLAGAIILKPVNWLAARLRQPYAAIFVLTILVLLLASFQIGTAILLPRF
jgi:hypothetical protein